VINQNPEGGTEQPEGTSVTIVVSSFEEPTETPTPTPSDTPTVLPTDTPTETPTGVPPTP
jgi:serine/threonine-protein kinase